MTEYNTIHKVTMNARHEGIFSSADEAITFACNYSSQQYALSPMAKIMQRGAYGSGRGLVGLDGAGQAGMVFAELDRLDYWQMVALVAGKAIRSERCDCTRACCRGWKMTELFREAVFQLADHVAAALPVVPPVKEFRVAVIMKYFGEKVNPMDVAEKLEIPDHAAERHATAIRKCVRELKKNGLTALNERLDEIGMLLSNV
ncbi:hypothetical protein [Paraburkholderia pallida]|uniref:DNA-binding protein n=1 Tax=Paraburkholderia pallida TaxID=2547399 RepID=A0A4P7CWD3_9BURK|nr:hypothetical protein [Paraburkholderia pallida]QBR00491.1 hypothetical protein E1956_26005 [Paraburkholderia pallida]